MTTETTQGPQNTPPSSTEPLTPSTALAQRPASSATIEMKGGEIVKLGFDTLAGFEGLQRGAKLLASSSLVPKQFQNNIPNCVIVLNMAIRLGADPLMVAQNLYVVHERPGWSGQFYIASFNNCGRFSPIRYRFTGQKGTDDYGCIAWAREKESGEIVESSEVTVRIAKAEGWWEKNPKWRNITQHMLMLRSGAWLVRTVAPELAMGLKTVEELQDIDPNREEDTFTAPDPPAAKLEAKKNGKAANSQPAAQAARAEPVPGFQAEPEQVSDTLKAAQSAAASAFADDDGDPS